MDFKKIALSFVVAFSVCSLSAQAQSQCSKDKQACCKGKKDAKKPQRSCCKKQAQPKKNK